MHQTWVSIRVFLTSSGFPKSLARRKVAPQHGNHIALATYLTRVAACVGALFAACIVCEAFDTDLAPWPFGTEYFTVASVGPLASGARGACAFSGLLAAYGFVMAAGALLVVRYRARSALATDEWSTFVEFHRAEPWGCHDDWRPGARPLCLRHPKP